MSLSNTEKNRSDKVGILKNYVIWWVLFTVLFGVIAALLGTDGTPDFRIYHLYSGFAAHHDRSALDIVAAQMQTAFYPGVDAVYYSLFTALNTKPVLLNVVLSLPYSIAAFTIFLIARLFVGRDVPLRNVVSAAAAVFGLTGASALPTIATTMTDVVPGVPFLLALAIWLYLERAQRNTLWTLLAVGFIAGLSVGLKLTLVPLFIAMFVAIALRWLMGSRRAIWEAIAFGFAGVVAFAIVDAAWLWGNYQHYGNPMFPFMNHIFKSDLVAHSPWTDLRFLPQDTLMALFYPVYWAFWPSHLAIELDMRDPRILIGWASSILVIVGFVIQRVRGGLPTLDRIEGLGFCLAIVFLLSYALWEKVWSIYRYLAIQETLAGVMLLVALRMLFASRYKAIGTLAIFTAIVGVSMWTTQYPWWGRTKKGPQAISVKLPPIETNAMVVFLDPYAYSYLVPFMPETVRAIGGNTNLVRPGSPGTLQQSIEKAISDHQGPLWGMEYPQAFPGVADFSLNGYNLTRDGECVPLESNLEDHQFVRICRLKRIQ